MTEETTPDSPETPDAPETPVASETADTPDVPAAPEPTERPEPPARRCSVRAATEEHAEAIAALLEQLGYPQDDDLVERLRVFALLPSVHVRVAVDKGRVVGVASLHVTPVLHDPKRLARISTMVVDEKHRGRGVGEALVKALEAIARQSGCQRIETTSRLARTEAHEFYEGLGYEHVSRRYLKVDEPPAAPTPKTEAPPETTDRPEENGGGSEQSGDEAPTPTTPAEQDT